VKTPPVQYTTAEINSLWQPSHSLGANVTAEWTSANTVVMTIIDSTGATAPLDGNMFSFNIQAAADIRVTSNNSFPTQGTTISASGIFYWSPGTLLRLYYFEN